MIHLQTPRWSIPMVMAITLKDLPDYDDLRGKIIVYLFNQFCERGADLLYHKGPMPMSTDPGSHWTLARVLNAYGMLEFFSGEVLYKHRDVLELVKNRPRKARKVARTHSLPCLAGEREYINCVLSEAHRVELMREDEMTVITGPEDLEAYVTLLSN